MTTGCAMDEPARAPVESPATVTQRSEPVRTPAKAPVKVAQPAAPAPANVKTPRVKNADARALLEQLIPTGVADRSGWATDIHTALSAMDIAQTPENFCAVIAVTEQESGFRADPSVPGLSKIAWQEIEKQREHIGVPKVILQTALKMQSSTGRTYSERLDTVQTERELSEVFDDFIGKVPMGSTFFANRNPVRTGGPMQVSVGYAEKHAALRKYPYSNSGSLRNEVFTRRGGMYFGIAHLLDYPASYGSHLFRFADFNAGHYASRNAAFQQAVTVVSGIPLDMDGDLLRYEHGQAVAQPGATELAARGLASQLEMSATEIRRDLERGRSYEFERTRLYARLYALADKANGKPLARAAVPRIVLQSPKFTRKLTTAWFAKRVEDRQKRCLARVAEAG